MRDKSQSHQAVKVEMEQWKRVLKWEEEPVLTISLQYPKLPEDNPGTRRVSKYYHHVAEQWKERWKSELFAQAQEVAQAARAASRPFHPWEAALTYQITYLTGEMFSLYMDAYEYAGGAHGITVRSGDTWEMPSGTPRTLPSFFPPHSHWKQTVLDQAAQTIQARLDTGESWFDQDWREKLVQEFDPNRFYHTEDGLAIFYPLYSIAPYAEGIPVFPIALPDQPEEK